METAKIEGLTPKTKLGEGISAYIRETLRAIPEGEVIYLQELAADVQAKFPTVKNRQQAYIRVGMVIKKVGLPKFLGRSGMTMVGRPNSRKTAEAIEFGL